MAKQERIQRKRTKRGGDDDEEDEYTLEWPFWLPTNNQRPKPEPKDTPSDSAA